MMNSKIVRLVCFLFGIGTFAVGQSAPQPAETPAEGETVHVLVGKSVVINVQAPLTRILSSNPTAVETMATSPTQVAVEGKAAGESSLILWDESGRSQVLDVAVDLDIAGLRSAIQRSYPRENLEVEADAGRLVLTGTAPNAHVVEDLSKMAAVYSTQVVNSVRIPLAHERQLMLEVKFAEVDRTALSQFGFNILSTRLGKTIGTTTTGHYGGFAPVQIKDSFGPGTAGLPFSTDETISQVLNVFLFLPDIHLGALIQDLQTRTVLHILASANLMAISGQKATFLAGGEFPFPIVQPSAGFNTVTLLFKPFGVKLDFTGFIEEHNTLRLHVFPEVSTLDF